MSSSNITTSSTKSSSSSSKVEQYLDDISKYKPGFGEALEYFNEHGFTRTEEDPCWIKSFKLTDKGKFSLSRTIYYQAPPVIDGDGEAPLTAAEKGALCYHVISSTKEEKAPLFHDIIMDYDQEFVHRALKRGIGLKDHSHPTLDFLLNASEYHGIIFVSFNSRKQRADFDAFLKRWDFML